MTTDQLALVGVLNSQYVNTVLSFQESCVQIYAQFSSKVVFIVVRFPCCRAVFKLRPTIDVYNLAI